MEVTQVCEAFPAHKGAFVVPFTAYSPVNWSLALRPARLERATYGFEVHYSIQMSYERNTRFQDRRNRVDDGVCPPSLSILLRASGPGFSPGGVRPVRLTLLPFGGLNPSNPDCRFKNAEQQ